MVAVRVVLVLIKQCADLGCGDLAVLLRQREHLVPAELDGAGLVHADVPRVRGNHTLVRAQQRVDDGRVRLCAFGAPQAARIFSRADSQYSSVP